MSLNNLEKVDILMKQGKKMDLDSVDEINLENNNLGVSSIQEFLEIVKNCCDDSEFCGCSCKSGLSDCDGECGCDNEDLTDYLPTDVKESCCDCGGNCSRDKES